MAWGSVTSKDLVTWERLSPQPVLKADQKYDQAGIFTGCLKPPTALDGGKLIAFYTCVKHVPFGWRDLYPRNVAGIATASSEDGGRSWIKSPNNPILEGEPASLQVIGYRDPYVSEWPELDEVRGKKETSMYGLVAGSVLGVGPTAFFYEIHPSKHESWKYLGPLVDIPERCQLGSRWGTDFGMNWECTNFVTLYSGSISRHFLIVGTETDIEREHVKQHRLPPQLPPRTLHHQCWASGNLSCEDGVPKFIVKVAGMLDYGTYYAANTFFDSSSNRRIVHGWIPEEDAPLSYHAAKGWNGALGLPREVFLLTLSYVKCALHTPLTDLTCFERQQDGDGSSTLHTLGIRPIEEVTQLRSNCLSHCNFGNIHLPRTDSVNVETLLSSATPTWELTATISLSASCKSVGLHIRHNASHSIVTTIIFSVDDETIAVDRSHSTPHVGFNTCPELGPFTLFTLQDPTTGSEQLEELRLRIFSDADILEIFANDRFALATTVYSGDYAANSGITAFAEGSDGSAVFEEVEVWDGLNEGECVVDGMGG